MAESLPEINDHSINVINRKEINISGVDDVIGFDESTIVINTEGGKMAVEGEGLQITVLDVESGRLSATGKINSVVYVDKEQKNRGFFSRLLK